MILSGKKLITLATSALILSSGTAQGMFIHSSFFNDSASLVDHMDRVTASLFRAHYPPRIHRITTRPASASTFQVQSSITQNDDKSFLEVSMVIPTNVEEDPQTLLKRTNGIEIKVKENALSVEQSGNEVIVNATSATQKQPITVRNVTTGKVDFMQTEDLKMTTKGNTTQFALRIPIEKKPTITKTFAFTTSPAPETAPTKDTATLPVEK